MGCFLYAVKAPGFSDGCKTMHEDITALTGGEAITEEPGRELKSEYPRYGYQCNEKPPHRRRRR